MPVHPIVSGLSELEVETQLRSKLSFLFTRNSERMTGGYGHFKTQDHDKWVYFHFAYIPGLQLYLIEKSSEAVLLRQLEQAEAQAEQSSTVETIADPEMPEELKEAADGPADNSL